MSEWAECGDAGVEGRPVEGVVWRIGCCRLAARRCLSLGMLIDDFSDQTEYASHNVANHNLSRLGRSQAPPDLSYALYQLCSIASLELADYAQEQRCGRDGAWSRVPDLAALQEAAVYQCGWRNAWCGGFLRDEVLHRGVDGSGFQRFEECRQAWRLCCGALGHSGRRGVWNLAECRSLSLIHI